jgi:hypothetical protein
VQDALNSHAFLINGKENYIRPMRARPHARMKLRALYIRERCAANLLRLPQ